MPISEQAFAALRATVTWNPNAARQLLSVLREFPAWMKYKDDPYGPLYILLHAGNHRRQFIDQISVPMKPLPFPVDMLADCEVFGTEWRQRKFTKEELADAIEGILAGTDI